MIQFVLNFMYYCRKIDFQIEIEYKDKNHVFLYDNAFEILKQDKI